MDKINLFPNSAGVYIYQRNEDVIMVRVKGVYPTLELGEDAIDFTKFFQTGKIVNASKEVVANFHLEPEKWKKCNTLEDIDTSVFPTTTVRPTPTRRDLTEDEFYIIKYKYVRSCQMGLKWTEVAKALMYELKIPEEQVLEVFRKIDSKC